MLSTFGLELTFKAAKILSEVIKPISQSLLALAFCYVLHWLNKAAEPCSAKLKDHWASWFGSAADNLFLKRGFWEHVTSEDCMSTKSQTLDADA